MYLIHFLVLGFVMKLSVSPTCVGYFKVAAPTLSGSVASGVIVLRYVELPVFRLKNRFR